MARLPHARGLVLTCAWMKRWFFRFSGRLRTSATWTLWKKIDRFLTEWKKGHSIEVKDISYKRSVTLIFQQHISRKISCSVLYWISIFFPNLFLLWPFCAARRISFGLGSLWLWFHQFTGDCQTSSASEAGFLLAKFGGEKINPNSQTLKRSAPKIWYKKPVQKIEKATQDLRCGRGRKYISAWTNKLLPCLEGPDLRQNKIFHEG